MLSFMNKEGLPMIGQALYFIRMVQTLHRQKRITTVYATSDEKSSGASSPAWILPKEKSLWIVPQ